MWLQVDSYSQMLGRGVQLAVLLPEGEVPAGGFPTLTLLHGLGDDYTVWLRRTSIERYAEDKGLAVILPDTRRGWYTDTAAGEHYFGYLADELPLQCRRMLPGLSSLRERNFIAGISMGGYGALRCALLRPEHYAKAISLSGALDAAALPRLNEPLEAERYWRDIFGPPADIPGSDNDLFRAAEELREPRPAVWLWCGRQDFLYAHSLRMRDHLRKLGYDVTYRESTGDHQWKYWDAQIQPALDWLLSGEGNAWH